MSQITIKLSVKADALIAQLQKEIFNRRRKKVTAAGVVETLVESGAKSQSDKRFATSWSNLIKDIEKAAKLANTHGSKPSSLSDEEWAMVLSHRSRKTTPSARKATRGKSLSTKAHTKNSVLNKISKTKSSGKKASATKTAQAKSLEDKSVKKTVSKTASITKTSSKKVGTARPARRARKTRAVQKSTASVTNKL